ncbi:2,5-dihydroxypyridine 5,6-dioxygenase [Serratia plymuthica]|uniref:2,5-dihydroxypyridine 5,6-dioxygenase n=1 Tax=Serratia plymuthica TaxID=82996 RepID=UPI000936FF5E|nr:2,5-dihydroxypyridine 5,6-dioxygenase [Serratia plymuthica]OJT43550.1 2,5-dihydroxypyridine 5,6-dioxygenase [Serratia plymuthica]
MAVNESQLVQLFEQVLRLSKVDASQSVAILKSHYSDARTVRAATDAALRLGAKVYAVELPSFNHPRAMGNDMTAYCGDTALTGNPAAQRALEAADLIVDTMMLLHSPEQEQILKTGTRILLAVEPPEVLARMLPNPEDKARVLAAAAVLEQAKLMRVTSAAGSDFRAPLGQYPTVTEYGYADEPGRWDHWPSGFLFTWPNEEQAEGVLVLDVGDILLPFKSYARERITLEIEKGFVTRIHGGFEAEYLREYMKYFKDPEVYGISHIGWGLQPRAQWTAMGLHDKNDGMCMDARAFYGNFLFSTGPNTEVGGTRKTPCHMDIALRRCDISLDGQRVVAEGEVVAPEASRVRQG